MRLMIIPILARRAYTHHHSQSTTVLLDKLCEVFVCARVAGNRTWVNKHEAKMQFTNCAALRPTAIL